MKKKDLLNLINQDLLDRLFGFCYNRTANRIVTEKVMFISSIDGRNEPISKRNR